MKNQPNLYLITFIVTVFLSACGQRGALYHPEKPKPIYSEQTQEADQETPKTQ